MKLKSSNIYSIFSSNLNKVECKLWSILTATWVLPCSNLNKVECKFCHLFLYSPYQVRSNLNKVECKLDKWEK